MHIEEYEENRQQYLEFAQTVAEVVTAIVRNAGGYRLQVVRARAKDVPSVRKKLAKEGRADSATIEDQVKDLAGCRAIFYTNGDVEKLIGSRLIQDNFEVYETKIHTPGRDLGAATRMYTANHFIVSLRADRLGLAEYARFAGLRCEIQVVTILNHAWAELEHDIIYKAPELTSNFGKQALESIDQRLKSIAAKYLLPAGYEFHKTIVDFDRLVQGKELFDRNALAAIGQAPDNNARFDAIESFGEHVLPLYDDPATILPDVLTELMDAARAARQAEVVPIQTPFGVLPGKTFRDIAELISKVITPYRYLDVSRVLDAARQLHRLGQTYDERKPARELAHAIAQHDLEIWKRYGSTVQRMVVDHIVELAPADLRADGELLTLALEDVLGSEATGSTWSSFSVALGRGAVVGSADVAAMRHDALEQLQRLYSDATTHDERRRIAAAMWHSAQPPYGPVASRDLTSILMDNAMAMIDFSRHALDPTDLELARWFEGRVHRASHNFREVRLELAGDPDLQQRIAQLREATARFRAAVAQIPDFEDYKLLVGFDSVFASGWDERVSDHEQADQYRKKQALVLLEHIDADSFAPWLNRLNHFAKTESDDAATFMHFGPFVEALAMRHPDLTLAHLEQIDGALARFLPCFLAGLLNSPQATATRERIAQWLSRGERLDDLPGVLLAAKDVPVDLYRGVLDSAIAHDHRAAVQTVVRASVRNFASDDPEAPARVALFMDALAQRVLAPWRDWTQMGSWFSWLGAKILRALDETQAQQVIDWLVPLPKLSTEADHILAALGKDRPALVLDLLDRRMLRALAGDAAGFTPLPYGLHESIKALKLLPAPLMAAARRWFDAGEQSLDFSARHLLESVFEGFPDVLRSALVDLLQSGERTDVLFALEVLSAFEGQTEVIDLTKVAAQHWGHDEEVVEYIHLALAQEGGTTGFYGRVETLQAKRLQMQAWLDDAHASVRSIAADAIKYLDLGIADETQRTRAMLAKRRLDYNEPPLSDPPHEASPDGEPDDRSSPDSAG